jgi:Beta-lactamase
VADLARWVGFQLRAHRDPAPDSPVLAAASLREMHQPHYLADDAWTQAWGISWCASRMDDVVWITHSGGVPGFTSTVCFDPTAQVGAIVLLNGTSSDSPALAMDLAAAARRLARAQPPAITPPEPVPAAYRPLLGIYARPDLGGWVIRLEWRDGKLTFTIPESAAWRLVLAPTPDPDLFAIDAGTGFAGENVTFRRLPDRRVASVFLMDNTWARLDPVAAPG